MVASFEEFEAHLRIIFERFGCSLNLVRVIILIYAFNDVNKNYLLSVTYFSL